MYMVKPLRGMEDLFKALADGTRLRILGLLLAGEVCVCDIHESLRIPQSKASRHLAYLRKSGLVETRRDGLWVHYRLGTLADPVMRAIVDAVRHALTHANPVRRDAERLQKRTGCCVPNPGDASGFACWARPGGGAVGGEEVGAGRTGGRRAGQDGVVGGGADDAGVGRQAGGLAPLGGVAGRARGLAAARAGREARGAVTGRADVEGQTGG